MSKKKTINTLVSLWLKGSIEEADLQELKNRMAAHEQLRQQVDDLSATTDLSEQYRLYHRFAGEEDLLKLRQKLGLSDPPKSHVPNLGINLQWLYRAAACVALLLIGGAVWYRQYTKVTPPTLSEEVMLAIQQATETEKNEATVEPLKAAEAQRISRQYSHASAPVSMKEELLAAKKITTRSDKEFWQTLPDGSVVHLNYNTRLIYPEQFMGDTRDVILEGEAYFMVAKDKSRKFIVHTPQGDVTVHGTEFNVNTRSEGVRSEGEMTEVVLVKGSVSVKPAGGQDQLLQPGQKCSIFNVPLGPNGRLPEQECSIEETDTEPYVAWNTGKFSFEDCPLDRLMEVLGRWYGMKVVFQDDHSRDILFTGILSRYADISTSLKAITTVADVDIEIKNQQITIY